MAGRGLRIEPRRGSAVLLYTHALDAQLNPLAMEMEERYEGQIQELQSFMKQSWEDKQKPSGQYEEEQRRAQEETAKAAEKVKRER